MTHPTQHDDAAKSSPIMAFLPWLAVPVVLIVLDQLVKVMVVAWIGPGASRHRVDVVGDAVGFEYVENTGAAFGILTSATGTLAVVSLLIAGGGIFMLWREHRAHPLGAAGIALVVGGALGNVIDRIFRGYVVDFIAVGAFPRFNLADSAITIGVMLLLVTMVRDGRAHQPVPEEGTKSVDG